MNDSPVGCQSRLTEAASSRKKEPYRPHQAKPELVARLEVTSKGVFFYTVKKEMQRTAGRQSAPHDSRARPAYFPVRTKKLCDNGGVDK